MRKRTILETIIDVLSESYIFEMAFERKQVINKLINLQDVIPFHVLLVCHFPDSRDVPHWLGEIKGNLSAAERAIRKLKTKSLDYKTIYGIFVDGPLGEWKDYLLYVEDIEKKGMKVSPEAEVYTRAMRILEHICIDLSDGSLNQNINYYFENNK